MRLVTSARAGYGAAMTASTKRLTRRMMLKSSAVGAALVIGFVSVILHRLIKPKTDFRVTVIRD